ncbi:MAG: hypothetical protein RLZZ46_76 [Bacteroidota bacterium]|jgi:hypothetical protein
MQKIVFKDSSRLAISILLFLLNSLASFAQYTGGNGRGDGQVNSLGASFLLGNCVFDASVSPAGTVNACIGGQVRLTASTLSNNPSYQWRLNGAPIGGANQDFYMATLAGTYEVLIYEAGTCPRLSNSVTITFSNPAPALPTITSTGSLGACGQGSVSLTATAPGSLNLFWSNGDTGSTINVNQSGAYFVTASYSVGCQSVSAAQVIVGSQAINPGICVVSVDSATNHNLILWEPVAANDIDSILIFRQSELDSVYSKIGARAYEDLSEYIDSTGNPDYQSYRYKIAVLDTCGGLSQFSEAHRTMNLHVFPDFNAFRFLSWNEYEGLDSVQYQIWRNYPGGTAELLITLAAGTTTWTDTTSVALNGNYWLTCELPAICTSIDRRPLGRSRSNVGNNQGIVVNGIRDQHIERVFNVSPNPGNGELNLDWKSERAERLYLELIDSKGTKVEAITIQAQAGKNKHLLDFRQPAGLYLLKITAPSGICRVMPIVIAH